MLKKNRWIVLACLAFFCGLPSYSFCAEPPNGLNIEAPLNVRMYPKLSEERALGKIVVNGQPLKVVFDTGAGVNLMLFKPTADRLNLDLTPREKEPGCYEAIARIGMDDAGTLSEPTMVQVIDAPPNPEFDGIIGWPNLKNLIWELNVPTRQQAFHDELPDEVKDWHSYAVETSKTLGMRVIVERGGEKYRIRFDTGATGGIYLGPKEWESWFEKNKPDWVTAEAGYSPANKDGFHVKHTAVADHYMIGDLDLGQVIVQETFVNILLDGSAVEAPYLIGLKGLRNRRVIIDGPGARIYFGPIVEPYKEMIDINRAQATYVPDSLEDTEQTAHVIEGGVAHRAGLRNGDKVLMINGSFTSNWKTDESVRPSHTLNQAPGTRVRLLVERDGERFPITFDLGKSPFDWVENKP